LLSTANDAVTRLWHLGKTPPQLSTVPQTGTVFAVAFSKDNKRFLTAGADESVRMWDAGSVRPLGASLPHQWGIFRRENQLAFHPDGKSIATRDLKGIVRVWEADWDGSAPLLPLYYNRIQALGADGRTVAALTLDQKTARLWQTEPGRPA